MSWGKKKNSLPPHTLQRGRELVSRSPLSNAGWHRALLDRLCLLSFICTFTILCDIFCRAKLLVTSTAPPCTTWSTSKSRCRSFWNSVFIGWNLFLMLFDSQPCLLTCIYFLFHNAMWLKDNWFADFYFLLFVYWLSVCLPSVPRHRAAEMMRAKVHLLLILLSSRGHGIPERERERWRGSDVGKWLPNDRMMPAWLDRHFARDVMRCNIALFKSGQYFVDFDLREFHSATQHAHAAIFFHSI